jgi:GDSL-like Lipase/Acylhydrolase family/N-terminus of Esterase_SGNH_hydro-type
VKPIHCLLIALVLPLLLGAAATETIDARRGVQDPCDNTVWYDGTLLRLEGKGWEETESYYDRLPAKAREMVRPPVWNLSHHTAGMCVYFVTDAESVKIRWTVRGERLAMPHMPATGVSGIDLYGRADDGRWVFRKNGRPVAVSNEASFAVTPRTEYMLYLPLYNGVKAVEIGIQNDRTLSIPVESVHKLNKPVVFYGTSITQGGCASRPGMACTAIVQRQLDVPIVNLGFSGNGKMEPEMAELLAELDPAVYVLDCIWNMSAEMVAERVGPFVQKLRQAHLNTPILLAEDSSVSNTTPTEKGAILRTIYQELKSQGITNLYFLSNQNMLGEDGDGTVDGVHPNDVGMMRQATIFSTSLAAILGTKTNVP